MTTESNPNPKTDTARADSLERIVLGPNGARQPLTEDGLKSLIGRKCAVACKSTPCRRWWVTIQSVRYVNQRDAIAIVGAGRAFGNNRSVALSELQWR